MSRTSDAKERLLDAVLELMWEGSYGAVTIDDICTRANVKKGSFYHFFESKVDLAAAGLDALWQNEWKPVLDAKFSPSVEPLKRITSYLEAAYTKQCELKLRTGKALGCPLCSVGSEVSTQESKLTLKVREILALKRRYWESALRDAVAEGAIEPCDPVEKAASLSGLIEGIVSQSRIMNNPDLMRNLPQLAIDYLRPRVPVSR